MDVRAAMSVQKCSFFFFEDLEGLTEILAGCPQGRLSENFWQLRLAESRP